MSLGHTVFSAVNARKSGSYGSGWVTAIEGEVRLLSGSGVDCFVHHRLARLEKLGPPQGVTLAEGSQACLQSPVHSLGDTVALRVVRTGVAQCNTSAPGEFLERA